MVLASGLLTVGFEAWAITVSVVPNMQTVNLGDMVSTEIVISDLAPGGAPSLGVFDLNLTFDDSILSIDTTDNNGDSVIDSVVLDPTDQMDLFGLGLNPVFAGLTTSNTLNLFELSFDLPTDLNALQLGSFVLAEIGFTASNAGISSLELSINALSDAFGQSLTADVQNGNVTVSPPIPIVSSLWLSLVGLVTIAFKRNRTSWPA